MDMEVQKAIILKVLDTSLLRALLFTMLLQFSGIGKLYQLLLLGKNENVPDYTLSGSNTENLIIKFN